GRGARPERVVLGRGAEVVQNKRLLGISFQVSESAPRARGDGPDSSLCHPHTADCSPRTRGWSQSQGSARTPPYLLPAHAGMVPSTRPPNASSRAAPRARGDGPVVEEADRINEYC